VVTSSSWVTPPTDFDVEIAVGSTLHDVTGFTFLPACPEPINYELALGTGATLDPLVDFVTIPDSLVSQVEVNVA